MTALMLGVVPAQRTPDPAERWEIVTRAQQGDPTAFADLYQLYKPKVHAFIYRRTSNQHLTEDLTQDVFVRALKGIGGVSWQGRDIAAWLFTIARNLVADHYKSGRYRMEFMPGAENTPEDVDYDRRGDPAEAAVHNAIAPMLDAALVQLTGDQRQVIALRFGAGLSVVETARVMGREESAVKSVQFRAVRNLARILRLAGEAPC